MQINFTNESEILTSTKDFVFISYSHKDGDTVFNDLTILDSCNMNYWVDKELLVGEKWNDKVLNIIGNQHCRGAILFVSPNYFLSEAAESEIEYCFKKKEKDNNFVISIISCNNRSILGNICLVFASLREANDNEIQKSFPQKRLYTITKYLERNILYTQSLVCCNDNSKKQFFDTFRQYASSVFDDSKLYHKMLSERMGARNVDGINEVDFGLFPMCRTDMDGCLLIEGYNLVEGNYLYKRRGQVYLAQSITWRVVDINDKEVILLSDRALLYAQPNSLINNVSDVFPIKIEEKYIDAIKGISLFSVDDEEKLSLLLKNELSYTQFAQDSKTKPFPDVYIFGEKNKIAYSSTFKKLQVSITETNFGYIYPCLKLDTKSFLNLEENNE